MAFRTGRRIHLYRKMEFDLTKMEASNSSSTETFESTAPILKREMRTRSRFCPSIFGHHLVTVEPMMFLLVLTQAISIPLVTQFLLVRTCTKNLNYNSTICNQLEKPSNDSTAKLLESEVQPITTEILMAKKILESIIPAIFALFLGPWSDKYGRKTPMIWALLAYSVQYFMAAIITQIPELHSQYLLVTSLPFILSGGYMTINACAIVLLADITSNESRSLRMGIFEGVLYFGYVLGMFVTAPIFTAFGEKSFIVLFTFCGTVCFLNAIYVCLFIPESVDVKENHNAPFKNLKKLFDREILRRTYRVCFTKRNDCKRHIIIFMTIVMAANLFVFDGESDITYLFVRIKFEWSIQHFTIFYGLTVLGMVFGTFIGVTVFSSYFKVDDLNFITFSISCRVVTTLINAYASTDWHMYLAGAVAMFGAVSAPLARSYISKKIPKEIVGVVFALILAIEGLMPLVAAPIYASVYKATLATSPGSVFLVSTAIFLIAIFLNSYVMFVQNRAELP